MVEGGVAQVSSGPGGALHRAYHVGQQLREHGALLPTHVLVGAVVRAPAYSLPRTAPLAPCRTCLRKHRRRRWSGPSVRARLFRLVPDLSAPLASQRVNSPSRNYRGTSPAPLRSASARGSFSCCCSRAHRTPVTSRAQEATRRLGGVLLGARSSLSDAKGAAHEHERNCQSRSRGSGAARPSGGWLPSGS